MTSESPKRAAPAPESAPTELAGTIDFAILTIKEEEFEAVLSQLPPSGARTVSLARAYALRQVPQRNGNIATVAVTRCPSQGNGVSQDVARDILHDLDPQWILVVGIAGGVPSSEFSLGDVLLGSGVMDMSVEEIRNRRPPTTAADGHHAHPDVENYCAIVKAEGEALGEWNRLLEAPFESMQELQEPAMRLEPPSFYGSKEWIRKTQDVLRAEVTKRPRRPRVSAGLIAASDKLIKSTPTLARWLAVARQIRAVEMESAGVYRAARGRGRHRKEYPAMAIRGISDVVGFKRDDAWTKYACVSAAAFAHAFIASGHVLARRGREETTRTGTTEFPRSDSLASVSDSIAAYRQRRRSSFGRWSLGESAPSRPAGIRADEAKLDDLYVPLRFAKRPSLPGLGDERGTQLSVEEIARLQGPIAIIGNAGSGKTTWMRWTFRRLLERDNLLPFYLELRRVVDQADNVRFEDLLAAELGASPNAVLSASSRLRPVLLVDGWDEVGERGDRLRERLLEFRHSYPNAVLVVTSRPFGATRPAGAEGFLTGYVQGLSDRDVRAFVATFEEKVVGLAPSDARAAADDFMRKVDTSHSLRALADTPLHLVMMCLLRQETQLTANKHRLFKGCLRKLLVERVDRNQRDGVEVADDEWRPDGIEDRLRAVAALAYRLQHLRSREDGSVRWPWERVVACIEPTWTEEQRTRFLRWLVARANVLVDRVDGVVEFAHTSFLDHLAAECLFAQVAEPLRCAQRHATDHRWRESLRLWAGLLHDQRPTELVGNLAVLQSDADGYWIAGDVYAQGGGDSAGFEAWTQALPRNLGELGRADHSAMSCAMRWRESTEGTRRAGLERTLAEEAGSPGWLARANCVRWSTAAGLEVPLGRLLAELEARPMVGASAVAASRAFTGAGPTVPDQGEIALLRVWPSVRVNVAARLQSAISVGAQPEDLTAMLPALIAEARRVLSPMDHEGIQHAANQRLTTNEDLERNVVREIWQSWGRYHDRHFVDERKQPLVHGHDLSLLALFRGFAQFVVNQCQARYGWDPRFAPPSGAERTPVRFLTYMVRALAGWMGASGIEGFAKRVGRELGLVIEDPPPEWLRCFVLLDVVSFAGRACSRSAVAYCELPVEVPEVLRLLRLGCRASLSPGDESLRSQVAEASQSFEGDRLWCALTRHLAGVASNDDRSFLIDAASRPERRQAPLAWGLQFYVRGDLMLDDGSIVTLDQLSARAGHESIPLLEEVPTGFGS
jgi:nucleoside phosphorylase